MAAIVRRCLANSAGDYQSFRNLLVHVYPGKESDFIAAVKTDPERTLGWKFRSAPSESVTIGCFYGDAMVSFLGGYGVNFLSDGRNEKGLIGADAMSHSSYRGRGHFLKVINEALAVAEREHKVLAAFGMANRRAHRILVKRFGFSHLYNPTTRTKKIERTGPMEMSAGLPDTEKLAEWQKKTVSRGLFKDQQYLKWRYTEIPFVTYEIIGNDEGLVVLKKFRDDLHIVDMIACNTGVAEHLLIQAEYHGAASRKRNLSLWYEDWMPYSNLLEKSGFRKEKSIFEFVVKAENIGSKEKWHTSMGDFDVF